MLRRCRDLLWYSLLRYWLLRCTDLLWYPCYVTCCYAAQISCDILATLHVATLHRSPVVSLLRYMLLRCTDLLWYPCYVTCCYATEISCGVLATLLVATLPRSPVVSLLRYMLLRCTDLLWYPCYVTCCYAAEISCGVLATLSPVVYILRRGIWGGVLHWSIGFDSFKILISIMPHVLYMYMKWWECMRSLALASVRCRFATQGLGTH